MANAGVYNPTPMKTICKCNLHDMLRHFMGGGGGDKPFPHLFWNGNVCAKRLLQTVADYQLSYQSINIFII